MTYEEIMDKIFKLEKLNNSGNLTALQMQKNEREIKSLKSRANKITRRLNNLGMGSELNDYKNILNKNPPEKKLTQQQMSNRIKNRLAQNRKLLNNLDGQPTPLKNNNKKPVELVDESESKKATQKKFNTKPMQYGGPQDRMPYVELEEDGDQSIVEKLVSSLLGREIRFEDIPDDIDDPDSDVGYKSEGHFAYPAGRPDLRMGGMTSRLGATTKFKKPLGMRGGGNITRAQRQRIARIMQDYKQKKVRKSNGKRTNR